MKCPYNMPLETYYGQLSKMWLVEDAEGKVLFFDLTEAKADYIVTAINAYDSMKEFIENTDNTESYREWCNCNKETGNKQ